MSDYIVIHGIKVHKDYANFVPETFGRLTTIGPRFQMQARTFQVCACVCGTFRTYPLSNIKSGHTSSCGCYRSDWSSYRHTTHGESRCLRDSKEYSAWSGMQKRCYNENYDHFDCYGGRGIRVCDRWRGPEGYANFLADMGRKPSPKHSLDRIDVNGDYCPENCRWATRTEQNRNQRNNRMLTAFDKTQCLAAWAEEVGIEYATLRARIKNNWTLEKALTTPTKKANLPLPT